MLFLRHYYYSRHIHVIITVYVMHYVSSNHDQNTPIGINYNPIINTPTYSRQLDFLIFLKCKLDIIHKVVHLVYFHIKVRRFLHQQNDRS